MHAKISFNSINTYLKIFYCIFLLTKFNLIPGNLQCQKGNEICHFVKLFNK